jgi:AraC-like DNA-binding protein
MGYTRQPAEMLGAPFALVDEIVFLIPRGGELRLTKNHFKLLFVLEGRVEHEIDGMEGRRTLQGGDILLAPVVRGHTYINPDRRRAAPLHVVRIFLDADHLARRAARRVRRPEDDLGDYVLRHFTRVEQLTGGIDTEIAGLLAALRRECDARPTGHRHQLRAICTQLLIEVSRRLGPASVPAERASGPSHLVVAAKEYILKHLADDLTLGDIAWHVGKGEEHLARVFKRETGRSVFDYVREARVDRARTLLLDPALSLTEIAKRCGFNSLAFFSRTFRRLTGMAPSEHRRHLPTLMRPGPAARLK